MWRMWENIKRQEATEQTSTEAARTPDQRAERRHNLQCVWRNIQNQETHDKTQGQEAWTEAQEQKEYQGCLRSGYQRGGE